MSKAKWQKVCKEDNMEGVDNIKQNSFVYVRRPTYPVFLLKEYLKIKKYETDLQNFNKDGFRYSLNIVKSGNKDNYVIAASFMFVDVGKKLEPFLTAKVFQEGEEDQLKVFSSLADNIFQKHEKTIFILTGFLSPIEIQEKVARWTLEQMTNI